MPATAHTTVYYQTLLARLIELLQPTTSIGIDGPAPALVEEEPVENDFQVTISYGP